MSEVRIVRSLNGIDDVINRMKVVCDQPLTSTAVAEWVSSLEVSTRNLREALGIAGGQPHIRQDS